MENNFDMHEWRANHLAKVVKEDFKVGGDTGLTMQGKAPTPVKANRVLQGVQNVASIMEDAFQAFATEVQQKYPDIFQDKKLLNNMNRMAAQIKQLKELSKGQ